MRKSRAFTLVELLVVIGIIALLISILLPALSKARKSANTARCLSNLRQVVTAFHLYAVDYKGAIPVAKQEYPDRGGPVAATDIGPVTDTVNGTRYWQQQVGAYIAKAQMASADRAEFYDAQNTVLWGCNEWTGRANTTAGNSVDGISIYDNGYGFNAVLGTRSDHPAPGTVWPATVPQHGENAIRARSNNIAGRYFKLSSLTRAGERIIVADGPLWILYARSLGTGGADALPGGYVNANTINALSAGTSIPGIMDLDFYRHSSKVPTGRVMRGASKEFYDKAGTISYNAAYADGHAETLTSFEDGYKGIFLRAP